MKRFFTVAVIVLLMGGYVFAKDVKKVEEAMKKVFPNVAIESFRESGIKGLYEVAAGDNQIFYFHPDGYLIFGEIWSKEGKSITAESRAFFASQKLENISLDKALKIGNGPNKVIEVSDPDCPFCRKGSEFFDKRKDVTRYVFLFPLAQLHPEAEKKAKYILCSKEPGKAYEEVLSGKLDKGLELMPICEPKVTQLLNEHREAAQKLGVQGTPAYWINGKFVAGMNVQLIEQLLKEGGEN